MHPSALTPPEQRVLGCLLEKRFTTPDAYPLSLNALRLAANQSTNRDPVMELSDSEVNEAAQRLSRYGLVRLASGHGSRAVKYRHLAEEALGVGAAQLGLLCVLLLRGPQTPGELKLRTERMVAFTSLVEVEQGLDALSRAGYAARLGRRPGQKEERWTQLLGDGGAEPDSGATDETGAERDTVSGEVAPQASSPATDLSSRAPATRIRPGDLEARVARLEAEVAELRAALGR